MNNLITQIKYPFEYTFLDYPDNESGAIICYFLGCEHYCNGCQNQLFQSRTYSSAFDFTIKQLYEELFKACYENKTRKIIFSGGDCLHPLNREFVKTFIKLYNRYFSFCLYTGYSIREVKQFDITGFKFIKTGKYEESLKQQSIKTDDYFQLASSNQEIYDQNFKLLTKNGRMEF